MFRRFSCFAFGLLLASTAAMAGAPPAPAPSDNDIVVKGVTKHAMDTYVRQTITPGDRGQLARWNRPICTRVINLEAARASVIDDRINAVARAVGAQVAPAGCKANVLVIATTDPDGAIKQVRNDYPQLFRFRDNGDRPVADYQELLKPQPIRWINASERISADGMPLGQGTLADPSLAGSGLPTNVVREPTGIDASTREDSAISIVVIDANKLDGIGITQLSDYVAMVVLGHPRFGADFKGGTILAMFADRDAGTALPDAMTPMDLSLLRNLYTTANLRTAEQQRTSIEYRMRHPEFAQKMQAAAGHSTADGTAAADQAAGR